MTTAAISPVPSPAIPGRTRLVARLILALGLFVTGIGLWSQALGWRTAVWPKVDAAIEEVRTTWSRSSRPSSSCTRCGRPTPSVEVVYAYEAGGRARRGSAIRAGTLGMETVAEAKAEHEALRAGDRVRIAVSPTDPDEAYLRTGPGGVSLMLLLVGGAVAGVGLVGVRLARTTASA